MSVTLVAMNDEIRRTAKNQLLERGIKQIELAEALGVTPQYLSSVLTGREGEMPRIWQGILGYLDLSLVAVKADERIIAVPKNAKVQVIYEADDAE